LIYKCNNRGGNDNISVAYLEMGSRKWFIKDKK
jgi:hypothetical protein